MENEDKKPGVILGWIYCVCTEGSETFTSEEVKDSFLSSDRVLFFSPTRGGI